MSKFTVVAHYTHDFPADQVEFKSTVELDSEDPTYRRVLSLEVVPDDIEAFISGIMGLERSIVDAAEYEAKERARLEREKDALDPEDDN